MNFVQFLKNPRLLKLNTYEITNILTTPIYHIISIVHNSVQSYPKITVKLNSKYPSAPRIYLQNFHNKLDILLIKENEKTSRCWSNPKAETGS